MLTGATSLTAKLAITTILACGLCVSHAALSFAESAHPELRTDALKLCFRPDARPFSYLNDRGQPDGYSVSLCQRMANELGVAQASRRFVAVTAQDRFEALADHRCDVLCEATSITLTRRKRFEFSLITFVTGATILYGKNLLGQKLDDGPFRIGLLTGTTVHEAVLRGALRPPSSSKMELVPFDSHNAARVALSEGRIAGHIADREILLGIKEQLGQEGADLELARSLLSYEPYGLAFRIGDDRLRLAMDTVLADLFRTGEIASLLKAYFPGYDVSPRLNQLFEMQAIPE